MPTVAAVLNDSATFIIPSGGWSYGGCLHEQCPSPFRYYVASPVIAGFALFGELNKAVPLSSSRFSGLVQGSDGFRVNLQGSAREILDILVFVVDSGQAKVVSCGLSSAGNAALTCQAGECSCSL